MLFHTAGPWHGSSQALLSSKLTGCGVAVQRIGSRKAERVGSAAHQDTCGTAFAFLQMLSHFVNQLSLEVNQLTS